MGNEKKKKKCLDSKFDGELDVRGIILPMTKYPVQEASEEVKPMFRISPKYIKSQFTLTR